MDFVGRKREIAAVVKSLRQSRNVVVSGRYGVGRSCLVKHIAGLYSESWQFLFADFSKTVARCCNDMVSQLSPGPGKAQQRGYTRLMNARDILAGSKAIGDLPRVAVLDNVGKISRQKLAFIRDIRLDSQLLFIAIAESFLPEADLFRLRSALYPSDLLAIHNLDREETAAFFRKFSQRKRLGWREGFIQMLAGSTEGYLLLMEERARREAGLAPNSRNIPKTGAS